MGSPVAQTGVAMRVAVIVVITTGISLAALVWGWTAVTAGPTGEVETCTGTSITIVDATYLTGEDRVAVDVASTGTELPPAITVTIDRDGGKQYSTTIDGNTTARQGIYTVRFNQVRYQPEQVTASVEGCPDITDQRSDLVSR